MAALHLNTTVSLVTIPKPLLSSTPSRHRCQAASSSTSTGSGNGGSSSSSSSSSSPTGGGSWATEHDMYELLGVDPSSPHSEIKSAYRSLQKRCHPDVAGAGGHEMAIVLNEVYSLLSDPAARLAYDREQAKRSEFRGYTGRPLYSSWLGGEGETRAVFVDEVTCVGCLKCALHAGGTFAIESVYGRARVVAQWADPEDKIVDAIQTCPVDCISMVERSDLAALEFLMSKKPRGRVRVSEGNTSRSPDIFAEVNKFKARFEDMKHKSATRQSEDSEAVWQSRSSAVQTIKSISNWWYWLPFGGPAAAAATTTAVPAPIRLLPPPSSSRTTAGADPVTERLKEAAARRKAGAATAAAAVHTRRRDDYWTPQLNLPSSASFPASADAQSAAPPPQRATGGKKMPAGAVRGVSIDLTAPLLMAIIAAGIAGYNREEMVAGGVIQDHAGGAVALGVVNSFELKVVLAGVTWFVIGAAVAGIIQVLGRRNEEEIKE